MNIFNINVDRREEPSIRRTSTLKSGKELRIMTLNVYAGSPYPTLDKEQCLGYSGRLRNQLEHIKSQSPDILCLQEIQSHMVQRYYVEKLADEYDFFYQYKQSYTGLFCSYLTYLTLSFVITYIFELSSMFHLWGEEYLEYMYWRTLLCIPAYFTARSFLDSLTFMGFLMGPVKGSVILFWKRDKLAPIVGSDGKMVMETVFFQNQYGDFLNYFRARGYQYAGLMLEGEHKVYVFNCHLNLTSEEERVKQVDEMAEKMNDLSSDGTVVLCGDFNAHPERPCVRKLSEDYGYIDSCDEKGVGDVPTWDHNNPLVEELSVFDNNSDHRCDFVFYKPCLKGDCKVINDGVRILFNKVGSFISDHYAIETKLKFHKVGSMASFISNNSSIESKIKFQSKMLTTTVS